MKDDHWTIYVTSPAQKMVEWDDWQGSLDALIVHLEDAYDWHYQSHNTITMEAFFQAW